MKQFELDFNTEKQRDSFTRYMEENPHVYQAFKKEAFRAKNAGRKHFSARMIIYYLRYNSMIREQGGEWKINNNYSAYFARLLEVEHPEFVGFFEKRKSKADGRVLAAHLGTIMELNDGNAANLHG